MDVVITYVNGADPLWRKDYEAFAGEPILEKRFRDWGTLPFLFRGLEKNMPFADKVFLVVARESQVPQWVDRSRVTVVCHADFIPKEHLPTFSASMIEMFLHLIPGLGEKFIYMNDDTFVLRPVREEDFFPGGLPAKGYSRHLLSAGAFKKLCRCSDSLARKAAGLGASLCFLRPQHSVTPMLRSVCEELFAKEKETIMRSLTPVRAPGNYNQYLFSDYALYTGRAVRRRISHKHLSMAVSNPERIVSSIKEPATDFVCINDVSMSPERFECSRRALMDALSSLFPEKSRYER